LEVTQIGKDCHGAACAIYREVGKCVMPTRGIFARVLHPGAIRRGAAIAHLRPPLRACVLTLSDRAFRGEYEDRSGPAVCACLAAHFRGGPRRLAIETAVLPDDAARLRRAIRRAVAAGADLIVTTGGTGLSPRDITPDTIRPLLDREIPGIMEYIRVTCGRRQPAALLSRSVAGAIGRTLIYALPGSVRAVREYLREILKSLEHALLTARGCDAHR
jgi:molybdenum cofactor synthesis domain-containing protein